jgi:ankyrin repeat domain-containing protein 50
MINSFGSATIIEDLYSHCESHPSSACAYFFFDGRDGQKNSVESLIRSLIAQFSEQFSEQFGGIPPELTKLYQSCYNDKSQPSMKSLQSTLLSSLDKFCTAYIVIDSLDECAEMKDLLEWIKGMTSGRNGKLHLLVTSRPEEEITKSLQILDPNHVCITPELVTPDIENYIDHLIQLVEIFEFDRWDDEFKAVIKSLLLEKGRGMCVLCDMTAFYGLTFAMFQDFGWFP